MSMMEFVFYLVTLKALFATSVFSGFAWVLLLCKRMQTKQYSMKPTNRKKDSGLIYSTSL